METKQVFKQIVHLSLVIMTLAYIISGFGITEYQIVESLTLGLLTRTLSFKIHDALIGPFLALLLSHLYLTRKNT
jgi:hypothetical protein